MFGTERSSRNEASRDRPPARPDRVRLDPAVLLRCAMAARSVSARLRGPPAPAAPIWPTAAAPRLTGQPDFARGSSPLLRVPCVTSAASTRPEKVPPKDSLCPDRGSHCYAFRTGRGLSSTITDLNCIRCGRSRGHGGAKLDHLSDHLRSAGYRGRPHGVSLAVVTQRSPR